MRYYIFQHRYSDSIKTNIWAEDNVKAWAELRDVVKNSENWILLGAFSDKDTPAFLRKQAD